jgi:type IV secretion system protein VirB1
MAPELLLSLTLACAPLVHPETALRLVKHESGNNPYAIGINGPYRLSPQPNSQAQAVATAKMLMASGLSIDMGLSVESVFDPCTNLQAMQSILTAGYSKAYKRHGNSQQALVEALSSYNTGHPSNGVRNGYVAAVVGTRLPPITGAQSQPNWNTAQ